MKAIYYSRNGGSDVLEYGDLPDPVPGPGEVLIKVAAISIEGGDLLNRKVTPPPHVPFVPGYQAAGTVAALGEGVTEFSIGQRVTAFAWAGSHAELMRAQAGHTFAIPDELDFDLASTIPVAFGTAHDSLFEFGRLKAGETVLVQGAAGGVGLVTVQLAKQAGAIVIGTSSSDERLEVLKGYGLDHGINYKREDIGAAARELTGGKGVDLVIDLAGGPAVSQLFESLRYRGRYGVVGASSGDLPSFPFFEVIRRSLTLYGVSWGREMASPRARAIIDECTAQLAAGKLRMPIDRVFDLKDAAAAHDHVDFGHPFGRVLMHA